MIKISTYLAQNFFVVVVYRHPNANIKELTDHFHDYLQKIKWKHQLCYFGRF